MAGIGTFSGSPLGDLPFGSLIETEPPETGAVVYTFSTPMESAGWPCFDVELSGMLGITYLPDVTISRGSPYISHDVYDRLVMVSNDGVLTSMRVDLPFQSKFTFETVFTPDILPAGMDKLGEYRLFIGVFDKQDNAGGILISKSGIALVSAFGSTAFVLPGSQHIFEEGIEYILRIVVDGDEDLMHLYVTKTSELLLTGQVLRYTSAAPVTPAGTPDSFRVEVMGEANLEVTARFSAFRCNCTEALIPNRRPIADAGMDQTANLGSAITHDGRNSYDPEGLPITYLWDLVEAPDKSRYKITGNGSTTDDGDADGFTTIFNGGTDSFSSANAPLLQPGDALVIEDVVYEVGTSRWLLDSETGKYVRDSGLWNDDELVITTDTIPDSLSGVFYSVLHSSTYFNDRTFPDPVAIPDLSGIFMVRLVVNDGELDSLPATSLLNVAQTSVAMGCIPEVSWIWNLLSDFWNLLEDREIVETAWSGFAQAAAAQLMTAWQIDYNKSLLDIQRVFQRRWLNYDTQTYDDPETAEIRIVRGPIVGADLAAGASVSGQTLQLVLDAGLVQTITFTGTNPLSADAIAAQINTAMGFSSSVNKLALVVTKGTEKYLVLDYALLLRIRPQGTANTALGFSTAGYTQNDLQGSLGWLTINRYSFEASEPAVLEFDEQNIGSSDLLVFYDKGYRIQKTARAVLTTEIRGLSMLDELPDPDYFFAAPWLVSSVVNSHTLNFDTDLIVPGDIARFEVKNLTTGRFSEIYCRVSGAKGARLGFDPAPLLEHYNGDPANYETTFLGAKHVVYLPVDPLVVEIPRLQEVIKDPPSKLDQNTDFTIEEVSGQNAIIFRAGTFSYIDAPPDNLWAEITYFDNRPTIEANFGRMVNFTLDHLQAVTEDLDYLSAVRGLWWAYFGGPSLFKVRAGTQILLGLPFSEATGTITSILPSFSAIEGRIIIEDSAPPNNPKTYYYPRVAGLGTNPITEKVFEVGDLVEMFTPLCGGVEVYDYLSNPTWAKRYVSQGKFPELGKLFRFLVRTDVDTFNLVNISFALDFVRKIKPTYTYPLFVLLKVLHPDEVDVDDDLTMKVKLDLHDSFCTMFTTSAYRWDDTDESGNINYAYDSSTPPPRFLFDTHRLCPAQDIWVHMSYIHPGGAGWFFDTIWAYDDGGGVDRLALSGPDSSPPPPYGPLVGTILFDTTVAAGTYHRIRTL